MRSYLRYWCDAFRLPTLAAGASSRAASALERKELHDAAMAAGTGAIMVVAHAGNWDHAGAWACLRRRAHDGGRAAQAGGPLRAVPGLPRVAGHGDPPDRRPGRHPHAGAARSGRPARAAAGRPRPRPHGVEVDFFGEPARCRPARPCSALLTGAPLHPGQLWYDGPHGRRAASTTRPGARRRGTRDERVAAMTQRRRRVRRGIARAHARLAHDAAGLGRRPRPGDGARRRERRRRVRIGLVCPYSWDVPGGVQFHVAGPRRGTAPGPRGQRARARRRRRRAARLRRRRRPADRRCRYNGSVARLNFGVGRPPGCAAGSAGDFDVLHVHEP